MPWIDLYNCDIFSGLPSAIDDISAEMAWGMPGANFLPDMPQGLPGMDAAVFIPDFMKGMIGHVVPFLDITPPGTPGRKSPWIDVTRSPDDFDLVR